MSNRQIVASEISPTVMMGFLEEKPTKEIQLFHEEMWQDVVYIK